MILHLKNIDNKIFLGLLVALFLIFLIFHVHFNFVIFDQDFFKEYQRRHDELPKTNGNAKALTIIKYFQHPFELTE